MTTIDNLMALALNYRLAGNASRDEHEEALRTALEALAAQLLIPPDSRELEQAAQTVPEPLTIAKLVDIALTASSSGLVSGTSNWAAFVLQGIADRQAQPVREPLTDDVIFEIACGAADEMWPDVGGVGWTKDDAKFYGIFCKKIERAHGIGVDK